MDVFTFAIGVIDPFIDRDNADRAIEIIKKLPGFVAVHPDMMCTLLCFDTLENAIISRGKWTETGNGAGRYIMNAKMEHEKGLLTVLSPAWDSQGGKVQ